MKLANIILITSFIMTGCASTGQIPESESYNSNGSYNNGDVSYQTFYDELQPYGNWINYPSYGYVWQPRAGAGFRPYETDGHWISTVDGWAWASDHSWGWAPFHYGRWLADPSIGWVWVPGYEWAPAWVTWGSYNNYYAWAPLAPGISIGFGNNWRAPYNYWSYAPNNCIGRRNLDRYIVRDNRNPIVVNNITIINNYNSYNKSDYYHRGPDYREVERYTHTNIRPVAIASANRPGMSRIDRKDRFEIYRPVIATDRTQINIARPERVRNFSDMRPAVDSKRASELGIPGGRNDGNVNRPSDGRSIEINDNNLPNPSPTRSQPGTRKILNKPAQLPAENLQIERQNQIVRDPQQMPAETPQPSRVQPVFQNNKRVIVPDRQQPNNPVIRQPQRQVQENREQPTPRIVPIERQRSIAPQPQNNSRERPVIRPARRQ